MSKELVLKQFQQLYVKQLRLSEARYAAGQDNGLERLNIQNWVAQNEQNVLKKQFGIKNHSKPVSPDFAR